MWIRPRVCSYGNRWCWNPSGNLIRRWTPTFRTLCRLGQTFASVCSPLRTLRKLTTTSRAAVTRRNPLQALNQSTSTSARDSTGRKKPLLGSRPSLCDPSYCSAGWPWVTVGAAQVEEVRVNKGDDILEEVGCLDGDRGQVRRLPRWRGSERSCGRLLPEDFTRRASELFAGALDRRLDDEVARVRGARDTRFPVERRLDRDGVLIAYRQLASEDEPAEYPGGRRARYLVEECRHDPAVRYPRRAVITVGDRVLGDDPVA